jgi:hypothetical protein
MKTQVLDFPLAASEAQAGYPSALSWRAEIQSRAIAICWPFPAAPDDAGSTAV